MEGTRQFQDRVVRNTSGRLGWVYDVGLRRAVSGSQVLLDAASFRIRGAPRGAHHGRCPGGTGSDCLSGWTQTQVGEVEMLIC